MYASGVAFIALMRDIMSPRLSAPFAVYEPSRDYLIWLSNSLPIVCSCMLDVPS
jgi:hypothetical protein